MFYSDNVEMNWTRIGAVLVLLQLTFDENKSLDKNLCSSADKKEENHSEIHRQQLINSLKQEKSIDCVENQKKLFVKYLINSWCVLILHFVLEFS